MGLFDSVYVDCPACGTKVQFQSKAGECAMLEYTLFDCPPAIAGDLLGKREVCRCGQGVEIAGWVDAWVRSINKLTIDTVD